jgi:hypothetical protein
MPRNSSTIGAVLLVLIPLQQSLRAQNSGDPAIEFKKVVAELSTARLNGTEESAAQLEKSLSYLDSVALSALNASAKPNLDAANQRLAGLVSQTPPVGENYRLVKLAGNPASYAMVANFGLGGPAAIRIYAATGSTYSLASKIDHFAYKDFFDSDVELIPVSEIEPVFVTVSGRTDDLSTGVFSAWRIDGRSVVSLWNSDLLQQSNYEADAKGFHLAYCGQVDEEHPDHCNKMTRDVYRFQAGEWKRIESVDDPSAPKPASK